MSPVRKFELLNYGGMRGTSALTKLILVGVQEGLEISYISCVSLF